DQILENYDQSLEDLERQREHLKTVMEKMGQEWEESGAGIGWLGSLDIPTAAPIETALTEQPLLSNILRPSTGPSPDYLQSLLNVNEALLAQSLANSSSACSTTVIGESPDMESHHDTPTPTLSP
ncbi:uncharacterized protein BYT42DRAFT_485012, partial [Radiomyces spectabilis]|uniref:uncharacterized protein n=1 Tax=Radiomyces spectabilis TaxID=64574 RepID=UPI0022202078